MKKTIRLLVVLGLVAVSSFMMLRAAAAQTNGGTRPGWGLGDKNHVHTGPPGNSTAPQPPGGSVVPHR